MRFNELKLGRVAAVMLAATALQGSALYAQTTPDQAAPAPTAAKTHFGTFGVDLSVRDMAVQPGDDFQKYASGGWLAKTEIPADKSRVGSFNELYDMTQDQQKDLITNAPAGSKYGAMYQSFMDEGRVE